MVLFLVEKLYSWLTVSHIVIDLILIKHITNRGKEDQGRIAKEFCGP